MRKVPVCSRGVLRNSVFVIDSFLSWKGAPSPATVNHHHLFLPIVLVCVQSTFFTPQPDLQMPDDPTF